MDKTVAVENGFKLRRSLPARDAMAMGVDPNVKKHLAELDKLLTKKIFQAVRATASSTGMTVPQFLTKDLTPKRVPPDPSAWATNTVARILAGSKEDHTKITLAEHIDTTPDLVSIKYSFKEYLAARWTTLDYNTRAVLDPYTNVVDYLVAHAFHVMHLADVNALGAFVLSNPNGSKRVVDYGVVSAARTLIDKQQLNVKDYNEDDGDLANALRASGILLSASAFQTAAKSEIQAFVFDSDELALINGSTVGPIPDEYKPALVKYIRASPITITAANIDYYLPVWLQQVYSTMDTSSFEEEAEPILNDQDFAVQFQDQGDTEVSDISRSAVRCAALLYHGMVAGDELDVFGAVNYFTHKYLVRGGMEIRDKRLRQDLRQYVFSDTFVDLKNNRVTDRTRPAERQMFYRQVFNEGTGEVTEDVMVNQEFKRLWKVLMLESAKYLQRAQASFHPDSFVSRQNVMQAVEDLQYNLSINCTGMVNVIAPLIDAELNFVLTRVLKHAEVVSHVVPSGGGWQRVVETLNASMKRSRPRATTLYNKARLGGKILRSVANYSPSEFEEDEAFSAFISDVDAYITTQSILQESLTDDLVENGKDEYEDDHGDPDLRHPMDELHAGPPPMTLAPPRAKAAAAGGGDEWDF